MITNATIDDQVLTDEELSIMQDAACSFAFKGEPIPPELWEEAYDDINAFVYVPYRQKSALATLYGSGADVESLLQADWRAARKLEAVRLFNGSLSTNVSFPVHVRRPDGEPVTVSIKENWDEDCGTGKPWYLSYVPEIQAYEEVPDNGSNPAEPDRAGGFRMGDLVDSAILEKIEADLPKETAPRDELAQWARLNWGEALPALAGMAVPEPWEFGDGRPYEILRNYLSYTFHRLRVEGKILESEDAGLAAFDTGLLHRANLEPIYACFWPAAEDQPRRFAGFCRVGVGTLGKRLATAFDPLPERASYLTCVEDLVYDTGKLPVVDYEHVLLDNMSRLPLEFLEGELGGSIDAQALILRMGFCEDRERKELYRELSDLVKDSPLLYRRLTGALEAAVGLALRRVQRCYGTAVPFYYVAGGYVSTLIPLDLTGDGKPDVALAVQRAESGAYLARTVLTLQMAYNGARLISGLEGCWLSTAVENEKQDKTCEVEACREPMLLSA